MSLSILIVDDSQTVCDVFEKTLKISKVPVGTLHKANDGRTALEILDKNWIDLVFADLHMPEMGGVELVAEMEARGMLKTVPVVIVSAEGGRSVIEDLKGKGIRAYIRKPFTPEEIQKAISDILGVCNA